MQVKKDLTFHFPPCHEYMIIQIEGIRRLKCNLQGATNKQVHNYIENLKALKERTKSLVGLSLAIFGGGLSINSH